MKLTSARPAIALSPRCLLLSVSLVALLATEGRPALAEAPAAPDKALAEILFRDGRKLIEAGQVREACIKLAESQRIDPKLGTLLNLAACHEKEGRTASAWAEFTEAASIATNSEQEERAELAKTHAADLERRLSRLSIEVALPLPNMLIALNERTLRLAAVGSAVPVDPGEYAIKVTAPGKEPWSQRLTIEPGPSTKRLMIPALKDGDGAPEPEKPAASEPAQGGGLKPLFVGGIVAAGVGLVGIGVGTAFGVRTLSKASDVEARCKGEVCSSSGLEANEEAYTSATISTVAFTAGLTCAAAGAVMMLLSAPSKAPKKAGTGVWIAPEIGRAGGQITLGGRW